MKKITWSLAMVWVLGITVTAQEYDPRIEGIMDEISLDTLVSYVRMLTGEDSVMLDGSPFLIEHRINTHETSNESSAEFLKQQLLGYGLQVIDQPYSDYGRNIIGIQPGTENEDQIYMICAHYDAVETYCADDNASGVAAVLEAARILSGFQFRHTIAYACWDEEETGLIGSHNYASLASQNALDIRGVINLDMIGWDQDDDGLMDIHTRDVADSPGLAEFIYSIDSIYDLSLICEIHNPGTSASDHSSFWNFGYSAVLLIEAYYGGDFNPYYHSSEDRVEIFNLDYFHEMSRLAIGSLSTLAVVDPAAIEGKADLHKNYQLSIFPNPAGNMTGINYLLPEAQRVKISVYNLHGQSMKEVVNENQPAGRHSLVLSLEDLQEGMYIVTLEIPDHQICQKLIVH